MKPPTDREQDEQALDFAYGNLAASTNHKPSRESFRKVWEQRGLPPSEFDSWADRRDWKEP